MRRLLASDMDGTVIPADQEDVRAEDLRHFREAVESSHLAVAYVTGRHLELAREGIERFGLPEPVALACDVGTTVYWPRRETYHPDGAYREMLAALPGVAEGPAVQAALSGIDRLELQEPEKQSDFKVSFYLERAFTPELRSQLEELLEPVGRSRLVPSHDPVTGRGLLDVLPADVGKGTAVEHIARALELSPGRVVFAGDSGNDRDAILSGMPAIVVGNAPKDLVAELRATALTLGLDGRIHFSSGLYAAGVTEGLRHLGFVSA